LEAEGGVVSWVTSCHAYRDGVKLFGFPLSHLLFANHESTAADDSPESDPQGQCGTSGQGYGTQRERIDRLLEWLAVLGNAQGIEDSVGDSGAARIQAARLRRDLA